MQNRLIYGFQERVGINLPYNNTKKQMERCVPSALIYYILNNYALKYFAKL